MHKISHDLHIDSTTKSISLADTILHIYQDAWGHKYTAIPQVKAKTGPPLPGGPTAILAKMLENTPQLRLFCVRGFLPWDQSALPYDPWHCLNDYKSHQPSSFPWATPSPGPHTTHFFRPRAKGKIIAACLRGQLSVPEASDFDVLGGLGAEVSVRRLDGLKHAGNLACGSVNLGNGEHCSSPAGSSALGVFLCKLLRVGGSWQTNGVVVTSGSTAALHAKDKNCDKLWINTNSN